MIRVLSVFSLFSRKRAGAPDSNPPPEPATTLLQPVSAAELLATPRRQKWLEHVWQRTSLSREQFASLYRTPLERYAALVQHFPASESHHHAYHGGMLDHGLECVAYALKLRQSYLLPVGAPPETQAAQAEAWSACTAYAALLHDIGKIAVDLHVEYADGERWHPWHGCLARPYRFRYRKDRMYRLHGAATGLLYTDVLSQHILDWLHGYPELWASLLYVLAGQYEHAGVLGELVLQADKASVAQELGGNPDQARQAPKQSLQRKLLDGLRYLVKERLKLNQPGASDGWLTQDALWLVSKTACDKLRAHLLSQGVEGIPTSNTAVFDVLQDHGIVQTTPDGKAIWRATVASSGGWTQTFTFLKLAPALIWESSERPAPFSGTIQVEAVPRTDADEAVRPVVESSPFPSSAIATAASADHVATSADPAPSDDAVGNVLALLEVATPATSELKDISTENADSTMGLPSAPQAPVNAGPSPGAASKRDQVPGMRFVSWLHNGLLRRTLKINDAKALVHTVSGTAYLVSPGIFQRYVQEHPEIARIARSENVADWEWVQKSFERLRLHKKQATGLNIWTCEVCGPRKTRRLHGYLLLDGHTLFAEVPLDNPYLKLLTEKPVPEIIAA